MESGTDLPGRGGAPTGERGPGTGGGGTDRPPRPRGPVAAVVALLIVGVLVAAGVYVANRDGTTGASPGHGPASSAADGSSGGARDGANDVTVRVTAEDGGSWVSAKDAAGELLYEGLLRRGEAKTFSAEESIDLVLGEASALRLVVNGKKIDGDFASGKVTRLTYTKDD
ncbi:MULTISPECIES: DUF4115 domain-containing protein [Streptomyces]|uniref:DUF4115 domain-containing protein n=1 Tax=Streptomyces TaxID=1883 RepID=UPI00030342AD|nr:MULTISPECIES: DUF4115 domain-containing protein [Streptomyces]KFG10443.1 hypothetical protein IQ61_02825 [Streptomyces scabiei]MDW8474992.1 DUF4115 domain-containing protein [Streptomyces scabiei]MDX2534609.1 DUF4115 domain-containing protein [Streptomyces scabiei]MDX2572364.1 DUF4115 domain-containing protein [Streptomyces scabiei]MDX2577399.1 DUF4115 domain-containing protein [Streptomyces scabiei]